MSLKNFLDYASKKYYEGQPIISDEEFDRLADSIDYLSIGYDVKDGVPHIFQMYSLEKAYVDESPHKLLNSKHELVESPKLDGSAVALNYYNGELISSLTRGDGIRGKDFSHLIPGLKVPKTICSKKLIQVTGEIVAPKTIENARNYASGALGLHDLEEFKTRDLTFVAYGIKGFNKLTYLQDLLWLEYQGFTTVLNENLDKFPQDGKVFRVNENLIYDSLGYTAKHPKGAFALKERKEGLVTTLLDVIWQVGKSGVVSPVGILNPINIDGAIVSRATLHNMKYINDLDLEIGCNVEVVRAGEIIPRVVRRVN